MVQVKKIQEQFNLLNLINGQSDVIGISSLNLCKNITKTDVKKSRGEFAGYYICDNKITLFRDRLGARNLYYFVKGSLVFVSTELDWIANKVKTKPNVNHITSDYLQFQIPFSDDTFFSNIKKVMPGEFIHILNDKIKREKYWEIKFGNAMFDPAHLLFLIKDAINYRLSLIKGKKYTSYLSGGIDSSTITLLSRTKECFSGFYEEKGYSEVDYIETVVSNAKFLRKHNLVQITEKKFQASLKNVIDILKEPSCGLGVIPQVIVALEAAKKGYKYAFTGEGGDEIFLGYNWNTAIFTLSEATRELLQNKYMVGYTPMIEKMLQDGLATFTSVLLSRRKDKSYTAKRILEIWDDKEAVENNILKINLKIGLPAILTADEQVGKYADIEPVSPLIDHKIVEYVCSVKYQERALIPKYMLREALKGILPEKIRGRYDKMGFPVPYQKWNWESIKPVISSFANRKLVDVDITKNTTMDRQTWALYLIELWWQHYFKSSKGVNNGDS